MAVTVVIGSQWGDEGKGKIVDLLAPAYDIVARFQGGANAGHTISFDQAGGVEQHVLHLLPSGVFAPSVSCVIGNGVVIDPAALVREIAAVQALGYSLDGRLWISGNAHCILPYHRALEHARETAREGAAIGTTRRGIGPAYVDKVARTGVRMADLVDENLFARRVRAAAREKNALLAHVYGQEALDVDGIIEEYIALGRSLKPFICDTAGLLHDALAAGKRILAEGAQGALLDVDFGTYPYVTSSSPTAGGVCTGLGVPPSAIKRVIGIAKAYCTRVGNGPFPTELTCATGEHLQREGAEFGATTGRPRRCGWLDLVALRYACRLNGFSELAITKMDVLSGLDALRICTAYRTGERTLERFVSASDGLSALRPVYDNLDAWKECITGISRYADLPEGCQSAGEKGDRLYGGTRFDDIDRPETGADGYGKRVTGCEWPVSVHDKMLSAP